MHYQTPSALQSEPIFFIRPLITLSRYQTPSISITPSRTQTRGRYDTPRPLALGPARSLADVKGAKTDSEIEPEPVMIVLISTGGDITSPN
ncbi:hypothetical protein CEXT_201961 [Caerostris extrusa]|uniref:Uncharacterized protein n=1 Tax=Caerostris extrusa TaxID=172846 RepID=A0AAV4TBG5_CAEEX|nr:hypothetical protein CEXT_201961 [Caerostris extrusa]